ncbi:bleomycin hydrolase [Exophiala xenobiotica]|nr:bleomycin hydrolase [Exophiala xenobiotica]KAK5408057.1 bleomycin hydrolase [Exophiala xenobiotica]KAK5410857.1 bleomycin hydrolase [Exophiala xenobiotica]KAK5478706.1 bleomycin hydrolase [Exophiala xenobiotica]KAK5515022.1 bleomycin hydrolase [Exophiala xenobiotica]
MGYGCQLGESIWIAFSQQNFGSMAWPTSTRQLGYRRKIPSVADTRQSEDDARNPLHSYPHAGPPPKPDERFPWEFYDKDDKYQNFSMPPLELLKQLSNPSVVIALGGADVPKMFSLVNDPRNNKYMSRLTLERLGNVMGGRLVKACRYWNISEHTGR